MALAAANEYTRFMVEKFDEKNSVLSPTAFQGSFFGVPETGAQTVYSEDTETVEIDKVRANGRKLATMVHRGTDSQNDSRGKMQTGENFTNEVFKFPLIEEVGYISSNQLLKRMSGESPYGGGMTREDRLTKRALDIHFDHMRKMIHTMEYLARESVLEGQHPVILGTSNTDFIYDFRRNSGNTITVTAKWDSGTQDINGDIDAGIDKIQQNAYLFGSYGMLLGNGAFAAMKADNTISGDADNRRYKFVMLGRDGLAVPTEFARYENNGFAPRGWIETDKGRKVWVFTYDLTFLDDFTNPLSPVEVNWMPDAYGLIFHPKTRCDRYFGPADRLPITSEKARWYQETFGFNMLTPPTPANITNISAIDPRMFHCDGYEDKDGKAAVIRTQASVILPTTQTDGFATLKALI